MALFSNRVNKRKEREYGIRDSEAWAIRRSEFRHLPLLAAV